MQAKHTRVLLFIIGITVLSYIGSSEFLHYSKSVQPDIMVVEGWLPEDVSSFLKKTFREQPYNLIVTTGINYTGPFEISENGYFVFDLRSIYELDRIKEPVSLKILAHSSICCNKGSNMKIWAEDSALVEFNVDSHKKNYLISSLIVKSLDSVSIEFTNDTMTRKRDRNLFIHEIQVDTLKMTPYGGNTFFDHGEWDGDERMYVPTSRAEQLYQTLINEGIGKDSIIPVSAENVTINRTLASAIALKQWISSTEFEVKNINIITLDSHSRRTWITYRKVLGTDYNVGIISVDDWYMKNTIFQRVYYVYREMIGYLYYRIFLLPQIT